MAEVTLYPLQYAAVSADDKFSTLPVPETLPEIPEYLVVQFGPIPEVYTTKRITAFTLYFERTEAFVANKESFSIREISHSWDSKTVNYSVLNTLPILDYAISYAEDGVLSSNPIALRIQMRVGSYAYPQALDAVKYGLRIFSSHNERLYSPNSAHPPKMVVELSDGATFPQIEDSPTGGYVDDAQQNIFSWAPTPAIDSIEKAVVVKSAFQWRLSEDSPINTIELGTALSYTAPANTFPSQGSFQWRMHLTDQVGNGTVGHWRSISTTEATSKAIAVAPKGEVVDGSSPIALRWIHDISTGTAQTKAEIQWAVPSGPWQLLTTVEGSETSVVIPANTFPAGTIWWIVRTFNSDGIAGPWSEGVTFTCVAASPAPAVSVNPVPLAEISWQSQTQQAYRITAEGLDKTFFGVNKTYKFKTPLSNGPQTVSVSVQNEFGLWSPAGVAGFTVQNIPGEPIELSVKASHVAELAWNSRQSYSSYLIYRGDKLIAETQESIFTDIYSTGLCSYHVVGLRSDGNYTVSNTVNVRICVQHSIICDVESRQWLSMKLSNDSASEQTYTLSRTGTVRHYLGSKYPSVELSEFESKTSNYTVAFKTPAEAAAFEALKGKTVCIKSRRDEITVGVLLNLSKIVGDFFTVYEFALQRIHWEGLD